MEIMCPECGARESYLLADGRRQCRVCRRKFTPGRRKSRLAEETRGLVREAFWMMQPAEEVAGKLNLNRKTVQKMYGEFRQRILEHNHRQRDAGIAPVASGTGRSSAHVDELKAGEFPIFYLADGGDLVTLFAEEEFEQYASALCAQDWPVMLVFRRQKGGMLLDSEALYRRMLWGGERGQNCRACLEFMLRKMKSYRGIPGEKATLYAEEMVFRFNCHDREAALAFLTSAASSGGEN